MEKVTSKTKIIGPVSDRACMKLKTKTKTFRFNVICAVIWSLLADSHFFYINTLA